MPEYSNEKNANFVPPLNNFYNLRPNRGPLDRMDTILNLIGEHWRARKSGHGLVLYAYPLTRSGNYAGSYVGIIFDGKLISDVYKQWLVKKTRLNYAR